MLLAPKVKWNELRDTRKTGLVVVRVILVKDENVCLWKAVSRVLNGCPKHLDPKLSSNDLRGSR